MRIALLSRIRFKYTVLFAVALAVVQLIEGTDLYFTALTALGLFMATIAFNAAGGFTRVAGAWIFFFSLQTVFTGQVVKAVIGEPGDSVFTAPDTTIAAYCVTLGIAAIVAGLVRKLCPQRGLLSGMGSGEEMKKAAFGSLLLGLIIWSVSADAGNQAGSFLAALRQVNHFNAMAILLGTSYQVKSTNGRSSTSWIVWTAGLFDFFFGIIGYSKEGMFSPAVTWLVAAVAAGHNFTRRQLAGILAATIFAFTFLVPYAQVGRIYRSEDASMSESVKTAWSLLSNLSQVRNDFLNSEVDQAVTDESATGCYELPKGFLDRLCIFGPDDRVVKITNDGMLEGYWPTMYALYNVIPHFLWPGKPSIGTGNIYAHEIGLLASDDDSTGISFSPTADAFHQDSWRGLFFILPAFFILVFTVLDLLSGDVRNSPWGLLFVVLSVNIAPEGMIGGNVALATYGAFGVAMIALISKYLLPVVSGVVMGSDRTRVRRTFVPTLGVRASETALPPRA